MLPERQQRVLSYFIKEAKDYFKTIEQGLINLQPILKNTKMVSLNAGDSLPQRRHVNEFFRVDHSLKRGVLLENISSNEAFYSTQITKYYDNIKESYE